MIYFWMFLFFLLLFIEIITVNLVTIWFAVGALFTIIASYFTDNVFIQLLVFILASIFSLILTRPLVKKFHKKNIVPTNSDRVIGKVAIVTKAIDENNYGEVKVLGTYWTAVSKDNISVDSKVIVQKIDGVKLIVKKKEEDI